MLENVQRNFRRRLLLCLENNGAHFEHLLHAERADNNAILPSLAVSSLDLAFTGWATTRHCLHWLGHHLTLP